MKKNIALFMAGSLALATLPLGVFAASTNTITRQFTSANDTLFTTTNTSVVFGKGDYEDVNKGEAKNLPGITLKMKDTLNIDDEFELTLANGRWLKTDETDDKIYGVADAFVEGFIVTRRSDSTIRLKATAAVSETEEFTVPVYALLEGGEVVTIQVVPGNSPVTGGTYALTSQVEGDVKVEVKDDWKLTLTEEVAGAFNPNKELKITIKGSDAEWVEGKIKVASDDFTFNTPLEVRKYDKNDSDYEYAYASRVLTLDLSHVNVNETGFKGKFELDLEDIIVVNNRDFNGTVEVTVQGAGMDSRATAVLFDNTKNYKVEVDTDKNDKVAQIISGRDGEEASEVVIKELTDGFFRSDRYIKLTLSEGEWNKSSTFSFTDTIGDVDSSKIVFDEDDKNVVYLDRNAFTFKSPAKNELTINPVIDLAADVDGEITLTISGPGVEEDIEVVVAETKAPVTVTTTVTGIKAGFTNIPTADVTITENFAGALSSGTYTLTLDTDKISTASSLRLQDVNDDTFEYGDDFVYKITRDKNVITIDVQSESDEEPAVIKVSGIEVYADSTVPTSSKVFKLELKAGTSDELVNGIEVDYLVIGNLLNEGGVTSTASGLTANVGFQPGETSFTVGGEYAGELLSAPYINEKGSMMVPVRALSYALGLDESDIFWHQATQTVTLVVSEDRVVQFTLGSDVATINGVQFPIVTSDGGSATVEMVNERTYLPLRFLGEIVFNVAVEYDAATSTAYFNVVK